MPKRSYASESGIWTDQIAVLLSSAPIASETRFVLIGNDAELAFTQGTVWEQQLPGEHKSQEWLGESLNDFLSRLAVHVNVSWLTVLFYSKIPDSWPSLHREDATIFHRSKPREANILHELYVWDSSEVVIISSNNTEWPDSCGQLYAKE